MYLARKTSSPTYCSCPSLEESINSIGAKSGDRVICSSPEALISSRTPLDAALASVGAASDTGPAAGDDAAVPQAQSVKSVIAARARERTLTNGFFFMDVCLRCEMDFYLRWCEY